jgi:serine/threonine protein kinase
MGDIFVAKHVELERLVALKVPRRDGERAELNRARLILEGRYLAKVQHSNVVLLYDLGHTPDGDPFLSLELLHGRALSSFIYVNEPLEPRVVLRIGKELARGLGALHRAGIVCGDVKPDNVMIVDGPLLNRSWRGGPWLKMVDLGVAQPLGADSGGRPLRAGTSLPGGTPAYASPEHVHGFALDPTADVYSLAVVLFELLTGALPFNAGSDDGLMWQHVHATPARLPGASGELPLELLDAILQRCLSKAPGQRFDSMLSLLSALDRVEALFPPSFADGGRAPTRPPAHSPSRTDPGEPRLESRRRASERTTVPSDTEQATRSRCPGAGAPEPVTRSR